MKEEPPAFYVGECQRSYWHWCKTIGCLRLVVTFSDRLMRFGLGYLSTRFFGYGLQLTVLEPAEEKTPEQELTKDLLALIASLAGQLYGLRSRKRRELLACAEHGLSSP